jgi:hypothetical protein
MIGTTPRQLQGGRRSRSGRTVRVLASSRTVGLGHAIKQTFGPAPLAGCVLPVGTTTITGRTSPVSSGHPAMTS